MKLQGKKIKLQGKKMMLQDLCEDLIGLILDFLDLNQINVFIDSSRYLRNYLKRFYCIILDECESEKYYSDEKYREKSIIY